MNGLIILDKPPGMTSHDTVEAVRGLVGKARVGHAGTLDPHATGILILLIGKATKVSRLMMGMEKEYVFTMQLGVETDTLDRWGKQVKVVDAPRKGRAEIVKRASELVGRYDQAAPAVSALKHKGVPLYKLARRGDPVPRKVRTVEVKRFDILDVDHPLITARVVCSSGTYVRSLARDMARLLGSVGSVFCLRRTRVGRFDEGDAVSLDSIIARPDDLAAALVPLRESLGHLPQVRMPQAAVEGLRMGRQPHPKDLSVPDRVSAGDFVVLTDPDGEPVAIARRVDGPGGLLATERVL
jgi:tRNA pseudouridine55 synthase